MRVGDLVTPHHDVMYGGGTIDGEIRFVVGEAYPVLDVAHGDLPKEMRVLHPTGGPVWIWFTTASEVWSVVPLPTV